MRDAHGMLQHRCLDIDAGIDIDAAHQLDASARLDQITGAILIDVFANEV